MAAARLDYQITGIRLVGKIPALLRLAVATENIAEIERLFGLNAYPTAEAIRLLIDNHCDLNKLYTRGSLLRIVSLYDDHPLMRLLLENKVEVSPIYNPLLTLGVPDIHSTPLMGAAKRGNLQTMRMLLQYGTPAHEILWHEELSLKEEDIPTSSQSGVALPQTPMQSAINEDQGAMPRRDNVDLTDRLLKASSLEVLANLKTITLSDDILSSSDEKSTPNNKANAIFLIKKLKQRYAFNLKEIVPLLEKHDFSDQEAKLSPELGALQQKFKDDTKHFGETAREGLLAELQGVHQEAKKTNDKLKHRKLSSYYFRIFNERIPPDAMDEICDYLIKKSLQQPNNLMYRLFNCLVNKPEAAEVFAIRTEIEQIVATKPITPNRSLKC